jgi:predicted DNA-binding transcriptional regulator AlpA
MPANATLAMPDATLVLTGRKAAELFAVSDRTWRTWDAAGHIPRPVYVGRAKFWRAAELEAWVREGCPPRHVWDALYDGKTP